MDKYRLVLQIFAILFILYLGYLFIKLISALFKKNRLAEFSLELDNNKDKSFFFNCIFITVIIIIKKLHVNLKTLSTVC